MLVRSTLAVFALSCLALVGCGGAEESTAGTGSDIIGGQTDATDVAVVELVEDVGQDEYTCTATFIGTHTLLTAAHCVVSDSNPKKVPTNASFHLMMAKSDATAKKTDLISITRANVHPHPGYDGDAAHDVAIVVLDHDVDVTPIAINRAPLTKAQIGASAKLVGYGQSTRKAGANDGSGTRRTVATTLRGFDGDLVLIGNTGKQACDGDSGGPAFLTIAGVTTLVATDDLASNDVDCTRGDLYQRVDLHTDFIDQYL